MRNRLQDYGGPHYSTDELSDNPILKMPAVNSEEFWATLRFVKKRERMAIGALMFLWGVAVGMGLFTLCWLIR